MLWDHTQMGILLILAMIFPKLVSTVPTSAHVKSQTCERGEMYPAPRMWVRFSVKVNLLKHWTIIISILFGCNTVTSCDPYHFVRALVPRVAINHQSKLELGDLHGLLGNESSYVGLHNCDHPSIQGNERYGRWQKLGFPRDNTHW